MAGIEDQVTEETNVLEAEFGGVGPRQILGAAMKDVEHYRQVIVMAIDDRDGDPIMWATEMTKAEMALLSMRLSGYASLVINDFDEVGDD